MNGPILMIIQCFPSELFTKISPYRLKCVTSEVRLELRIRLVWCFWTKPVCWANGKRTISKSPSHSVAYWLHVRAAVISVIRCILRVWIYEVVYLIPPTASWGNWRLDTSVAWWIFLWSRATWCAWVVGRLSSSKALGDIVHPWSVYVPSKNGTWNSCLWSPCLLPFIWYFWFLTMIFGEILGTAIVEYDLHRLHLPLVKFPWLLGSRKCRLQGAVWSALWGGMGWRRLDLKNPHIVPTFRVCHW